MIRGLTAAAAVLMLAACGDDDDPSRPDEPDLTRAEVAGQYEMTQLSFDPQGSLPEEDLLERLDPVNLPDLILASNEDSLQLVFRDPEGGLVRTVPGSYDRGDTTVGVELANAIEPAKLLLPRNVVYEFDGTEETLSFSGVIQADTTRLFVLVPEWSGEPVTNPLPGTLRVTFTRD